MYEVKVEDMLNSIKLEEEYLHPKDLSKVMLRLETTNCCNHTCYFCANPKSDRKRRFMDKELGFRLIREAYDMGVRTGCFLIFGEPLTNPETLEYYRYAKEVGYTSLLLATNLALADKAMIREIFQSGITALKVSFNGGSRESYIVAHGKDEYHKVMENMKYAYDYKCENYPNSVIVTSYVLTKDNAEDYTQHFNNVRDRSDLCVVHKLNHFAGSVSEEVHRLDKECKLDVPAMFIDTSSVRPCRELREYISVTVEGYLTACCSEPTGAAVIHDLNNMSLKEAWYSKEMEELRRRQFRNELEGTVCYNCLNNTNEKFKPFREDLYHSQR